MGELDNKIIVNDIFSCTDYSTEDMLVEIVQDNDPPAGAKVGSVLFDIETSDVPEQPYGRGGCKTN